MPRERNGTISGRTNIFTNILMLTSNQCTRSHKKQSPCVYSATHVLWWPVHSPLIRILPREETGGGGVGAQGISQQMDFMGVLYSRQH